MKTCSLLSGPVFHPNLWLPFGMRKPLPWHSQCGSLISCSQWNSLADILSRYGKKLKLFWESTLEPILTWWYHQRLFSHHCICRAVVQLSFPKWSRICSTWFPRRARSTAWLLTVTCLQLRLNCVHSLWTPCWQCLLKSLRYLWALLFWISFSLYNWRI